jgi:ribosomal protein S18 acetylase RimI-like enzyme
MKILSKRNGKTAGYLTLHKRDHGDLEIAYIRIESEFRGLGIATQLLERACEIADKDSRLLVAFVDPDGTGLTVQQEQAWLKRHGFKNARYDFGDNVKWAMIR